MSYLPSLLRYTLLISSLMFGISVWASPTISVASPQPGTIGTPTFFDATASTSTCSTGIAAIRIYTASGVHPFTTNSPHLETFVSLKPGNYNVVIQAWDNCGGISKVPIAIKVASFAGVHLFLPANSSTSTLVHVAASAESPTCSHGMAAMRIYPAPGDHVFTNKGGTLNVFMNLKPGVHTAVAQAWDNCGNVFKTSFAVNVTGGPFGKFLFIVQEDRKSIGELNLQEGKVINPREPNLPPEFSLPAAPDSLAIDPSGNFGYAGLEDGRIAIFNINRANGALFRRAIISGPGINWTTLTVDISGNYLFATSISSNTIASYRIDRSSGNLTFIDTIQTGAGPNNIATDWRGRYVYVTDNGGNGLSDYTVSTLTGKLVHLAVNPIPVSSTFTLAATDKFVFVDLNGFLIGINGFLSPTPPPPSLPHGCCGLTGTMALDPVNEVMFFSVEIGNGLADYIQTLLVQPSGALLFGRAIGGVQLPKAITLDPSYKFVYTADNDPTFSTPRVTSISYDPSDGSGQIANTASRASSLALQAVASP
jgi:6-phosphogluconolactonase (cycloisomerase 2 family)